MLSLIPTEAWEYSLKDIISVASSLFNKKYKDELLDLPGIGKCVPIRSGRVGILIALKALSLKPDSKIGVPLYCCPVVFKAIKTAGHTPVFIDVENDYCLSTTDLSHKADGLDALIAVHMFGQACDMKNVLKIMAGKPVIEDAAQSLGSLIDGKPTGTFGHIGVFSFRSGKYITSGEGGAIFCKNDTISQRLVATIRELPSPDIKSEIAHLIETYIRTKLRSRPLWGLLGSKIWKIYNRKVSFIDKSPITLGQIFVSDLKIAKQRIKNLNQLIEGQRENARYYLEQLNVPKEMLCLEPSGYFYNRFMFPIKFNSPEECQYFSDLLVKNNISSSRPYLDVIEGAHEHYNYQKDCPTAENLLHTTLVIPVHYNLRKKDIIKITETINKALKNLKHNRTKLSDYKFV
ncbi:MAG: hypothetical protein HPY46_10730 [Candidatus Aminicenantes bacterium]|nr:hypothetical protein [Candidatus Aminicenantes bacterium]